jgi:uncharacterized membrane protein YfcA
MEDKGYAAGGAGGCEHVALVATSFAAALLSELCGAALGFGPAILYEIFWQLAFLAGLSSGVLETAVFNIVVEEAPCSFLQLYLLREHFNLRLAVLFNVPVLVALPIGTKALTLLGRSLWAKRLLGGLFLSVAGVQTVARTCSRKEDHKQNLSIQDRKPVVTAAIVLAMFSSGFFRGMFGIAGPPAMVLLLFFSTDRGVWRCTAASSRVVMLVAQGLLLGGFHQAVEPKCWRMYLSLMAGGLAGLLVGNALAPLVDQATFQMWLVLFLVAGAMLMLCDGNPFLSKLSALLVVAAAVTTVVVPAILCGWRRGLENWQQHHSVQLVGPDDAVLSPMSRSSSEEAGWTPMLGVDGAGNHNKRLSREGAPGMMLHAGQQRPRVLSHVSDHSSEP